MAFGQVRREVQFPVSGIKTAVKVGALGPSGPFGRYRPVEGGPGRVLGSVEGVVEIGAAAAAAGEVEGYGGAGGGGGGGGAPGGVVSGTPRIRVATLGGSCCAPLPVTQSHNIGKQCHNHLMIYCDTLMRIVVRRTMRDLRSIRAENKAKDFYDLVLVFLVLKERQLY